MVEPDNETAERYERTDLSDLVRDRSAELNLGLRLLEDRCVVPITGERPWKRGQLDKLRRAQPIIPPDLLKLRALAEGLRLPLRQVQDAAGAQFLGIRPVAVTQSGDLQALMHDAEQLTPDDLDRLRAIAGTLRTRSPKPRSE